jgi:hypothetical protein
MLFGILTALAVVLALTSPKSRRRLSRRYRRTRL